MRERVLSALSAVVQRYPILSAIPVDENSPAPYFARLPEINLEDAVIFRTRQNEYTGGDFDVELDSLLETQHNADFKTNYGRVPFWRLLVLTSPNSEEFTASFIYHHALGDGLSGVVFQKYFHSALSKSQPRNKSKIIRPPLSPLLPSLEDLHPLPIPPRPPLSLPPSAVGTWTGTPINLPVRSNLRTLDLSRLVTSNLLQTCRERGTTLSATLPVIINSALSQLLPPKFTTLKCTLPVNIRRWLRPLQDGVIVDDEMGVWIDALSISYPRGPFSWEQVHKGGAQISDYIKSEGERISVARFKQVEDMRNIFVSSVGRERDSSFEVSNLGIVSGGHDSNGAWRMTRCRFTRSAFAAGPVFSVGVITGPDRCLSLGFTWQDGVIDGELMEHVVEKVKTQLELIASEKADGPSE